MLGYIINLINKMHIIKHITVIIISLFFLTSVKAECSFKLKFGDSIKEVAKKNYGNIRPIPGKIGSLKAIGIAEKICPDENLGNANIEFTLFKERLYMVTIRVLNYSNKNLESNKGLLFNYVKKNYGEFKGSNNMKLYDGFNHWKKEDIDIVYIKEVEANGKIREELAIFDRKYLPTEEAESQRKK
jgi:hypothetical protein|tara:strand:- start:169 stop:726 length:558 start_codon:yes stop_codon:yes gene_type:complete